MAVTAQLNGIITVTDSLTGSVQSQKQVIASYTGTIAEIGQSVLIGTSPTSITLPGSPTNFVYFRNLSTTATVIVTWTPNGGASNVVQTLEPGSPLILCQSVTGAGITALSVTASAPTTPVEYTLVA